MVGIKLLKVRYAPISIWVPLKTLPTKGKIINNINNNNNNNSNNHNNNDDYENND